MAHNLEIKNGEASMFYVNEVPWHKLGTKLEAPATAEQAIAAANLDWTVKKSPLFTKEGRTTVPVSDGYATIREDNGEVLGIVGKEYTPLQNREAFRFFDPIVGKDAAIYHTAGVLGKGEKVWILAKLPDQIQVIGDDIADKYLLLANGHDGKTVVQIKFTPVRVVCQNTLTLALSEGSVLRIGHHQDVHERLKKAEETLGIINTQFTRLESVFRSMTKVNLNRGRLTDYLNLVFPNQEGQDPLQADRLRRNRAWSEYFFDQGVGNRMPGVHGTLWAGYNGVTEFIDHRKIRQNENQRLNSIWFGESYRTKAHALSIAQKLMSVWLN